MVLAFRRTRRKYAVRTSETLSILTLHTDCLGRRGKSGLWPGENLLKNALALGDTAHRGFVLKCIVLQANDEPADVAR